MGNTKTGITQAKIERAIKGARAAGIEVGRFEIEGGKIVVYALGSEPSDNASPLDEWRRRNGEG